MGRPKKEKKGKFDSLPEEFTSKVVAASVEEIDKIVRNSVNSMFCLKLAQKEDPHIIELTESLKLAKEGYKQGIAMNQAQIDFCLEILRSRGTEIASLSDFLKVGAA